MDLAGYFAIALIFVRLASVAEATETRLHGGEFITYELEKFENNPRKTVIKLRFQTIHPKGLILYAKGKATGNYLLLDIFKGQVR